MQLIKYKNNKERYTTEILRLKNERTKQTYGIVLKQFMKYSSENPNKNIIDYILYLKRQVTSHRLLPNSFNVKISGLKFILSINDSSYKEFMRQVKKYRIKLRYSIPLESKNDKAFKLEEIKKVISWCEKNDYLTGVLCKTLYSTGLRISEVLSISRKMIYSKGEFVEAKNIIAKGGKVVNKLIRKELYQEMKSLFPRKEYFFYSYKTGKPLSRTAATKRIKKAFQRSIGRDSSAHRLKHSLGSNLASQNISIHYIKEYLLHSRIETTAKFYLFGKLDKELIPQF